MPGAAGGGWWLRRIPGASSSATPIQQLIDAGFVVIGVGGGGIPVIEDEHGDLRGIEAVIDKDFGSALLATEHQGRPVRDLHRRGEGGHQFQQARPDNGWTA